METVQEHTHNITITFFSDMPINNYMTITVFLLKRVIRIRLQLQLQFFVLQELQLIVFLRG